MPSFRGFPNLQVPLAKRNSDGSTVIIEGGPWDADYYRIVLSKAPGFGKEVVVQVMAPAQTQDQKERDEGKD